MLATARVLFVTCLIGIASCSSTKITDSWQAPTLHRSDMKNVLSAFKGLCDGYVTKPVDKAKLMGELRKLALVA